MFGMTDDHVLAVYHQLQERYPLILTNSLALNEGYTIDCPVLVGKAHGQVIELYSDGDMFILDVQDEAMTRGNHWHPCDVEDAAADIAEFMEGKSDYPMYPFKQV